MNYYNRIEKKNTRRRKITMHSFHSYQSRPLFRKSHENRFFSNLFNTYRKISNLFQKSQCVPYSMYEMYVCTYETQLHNINLNKLPEIFLVQRFVFEFFFTYMHVQRMSRMSTLHRRILKYSTEVCSFFSFAKQNLNECIGVKKGEKMKSFVGFH